MKKTKQKKAPSRMLGDAVRDLDDQPSKDWLKGFDAGYSSTVMVIEELIKVQLQAIDDCKEARTYMEHASRTIAYLDERIAKFTWPVAHKSIISDDIEA